MSVLYTPTQLEKGLKSQFLMQLAAEPPNLVQRIATMVPSMANNEKYAWIGEAPQMQEVGDEVHFSGLTDTGYTINNKQYAAGLEVKRADIMDDQTGGIAMRVRQLASVGAQHPNKLLINALIDGTTNTAYDGVAMFSNSHTARGSSGTIDNLLAGAGTSTANLQTDLNQVLAYFGKVLAENGEPFHGGGVSAIAIVAPWAIRKAVVEAIDARVISQTDNVQVGGLTLDAIFDARLDADDLNDWYALNVSTPIRPLIFQDREALRFEALETGDAAFTRLAYRYKAEARYAVGYGPFQSACKVVNT